MVFLEYRDETGQAYLHVSGRKSLEDCIEWLKKLHKSENIERGKESFSTFAFWEE